MKPKKRVYKAWVGKGWEKIRHTSYEGVFYQVYLDEARVNIDNPVHIKITIEEVKR